MFVYVSSSEDMMLPDNLFVLYFARLSIIEKITGYVICRQSLCSPSNNSARQVILLDFDITYEAFLSSVRETQYWGPKG